MLSPSIVEQDRHHQSTASIVRPSLVWLLLNMIGSVLASIVLAGTLAGRAAIAISPALLLGGAIVGTLPGLWSLLRGLWAARLPELALVSLAFTLVAGAGLWLAWPALLPLGRSVDAVHQYQLVHWIAEEQRLPPLDAETNGLLGEMIAYPTGLAFVVNAAAALTRVSPLDALFPTVALLGGLCAALVAQLAVSAAGVPGWRIVVAGLVSVVLLLAHRTYFLEAYIDSSYYAQMLGLTFALLACCWVSQAQSTLASALQLGLLLAALLATYPLWVPVPLALAGLALLVRQQRSGVRAQGSGLRETRRRGEGETRRQGDKETRRQSRPSSFILHPFSATDNGQRTNGLSSFVFRPSSPVQLVLLLTPLAVVAAIDLPARLRTGQVVLEHQGVVTPPTLLGLMPLVLALPAVLVLLATRRRGEGEKRRGGEEERGRRGEGERRLKLLSPQSSVLSPQFSVFQTSGQTLVSALGLSLLAVGMLALAAQIGLTAPYHSVKMLFLVVPLAAALAGAAAIRVTAIQPLALRVASVAVTAGILWFTSAHVLLPIRAEQIPTRDLVAAAAWLGENDPQAADDAILVGAPPGPLAYWLQVALLNQRRDQADAAMRAFSETPPTPQGWAVDTNMPDLVVAPVVTEAPPGSEIAAQFGRAAVLRRTTLDVQVANPLVLRYASRWEEERLKTALEFLRPIAGPLPVVELRLMQAGRVINTFMLQPNAERTKPQYLGADLIPATLGGIGYINTEAYPTFAPPENAPAGSFELVLRLSAGNQTLDERLLATFDRTGEGAMLNLSLHSGELDYLRREYPNPRLDSMNTRFGEQLVLTGWKAEQANGEVSALLRWQAQTELEAPLSTELRLADQAGNVVTRSRSAPQDGFYPTWRWRAGEDVVERRTLALPPNLPAGTYTLTVSVFDETTQTELPSKSPTRLGDVVIKR